MSYDPDPNAVPGGVNITRQLSQRDLAAAIPVNFVPVAGISLTPACFSNKIYEESAGSRCFSNLLAVGFQRFVIDLYWDASRHVWSLCPVELGSASTSTTTEAQSSTSTPTGTGTTSTLSTVDHTSTRTAASRRQYHSARAAQASSQSSSLDDAAVSPTGSDLSHISSVSSTTTLPTAASPTATVTLTDNTSPPTSTSGPVLIDVGPYSCDSDFNFYVLAEIMELHLQETDTNLNATLRYWLLNLHAASPATDLEGSAKAPTSSALPQAAESLSNIMSPYLSSYLYTPHALEEQRGDLRKSGGWLYDEHGSESAASYYDVIGSGGKAATPDGWPTETFVEMDEGLRLFVGFGSIDPQMQSYNLSADAATIFPSNYLQVARDVTFSANGDVQGNCFFNPSVSSVSSTNNSWSVPAQSNVDNLQVALTEASSLNYCGLFPAINQSLANVTADENYIPYAEFVQSAIWSWDAGQPHLNGAQDRCAFLNATSGYWQNGDCASSHFSACRYAGHPYQWNISSAPATYDKANLVCRADTTFDTPRTALENSYLLYEWQTIRASMHIHDELLYLDFNNLDAESCWVIGQNTTCPYLMTHTNETTVLVPAVAAIIVFVIAVLTVFVKCAANRRTSRRRRRRGDDGIDYEGVPS